MPLHLCRESVLLEHTGVFIAKFIRINMQSNCEQLPKEHALPVLFVKLQDRMVVETDPKALNEF